MRTVFVLVLAIALPASAHAQTSSPLRAAAAREAARLASVPQAVVQQGPAHQRSWIGRHPTLTGALAGLGIGMPIGIATCRYPTAEGSSCADYTYPGNARLLGGLWIGALGAGIGAGVGTLIGALTR